MLRGELLAKFLSLILAAILVIIFKLLIYFITFTYKSNNEHVKLEELSKDFFFLTIICLQTRSATFIKSYNRLY